MNSGLVVSRRIAAEAWRDIKPNRLAILVAVQFALLTLAAYGVREARDSANAASWNSYEAEQSADGARDAAQQVRYELDSELEELESAITNLGYEVSGLSDEVRRYR